MSAHYEEQSAVSDPQREGRSRRSVGAEALIGGGIVLMLVVLGIIIQQTIFYRFVQQNGGVPDGLFKTTNGSYYKLWSFTVPLWVTTTVVAIVGIVWGMRLQKLQSRWFIVVAWLIYVALMWSLFGASSGLVEVLGKGEAFI